MLASNNTAGGSSDRSTRINLMDDPPWLDSCELTDKGSINQRAVLTYRVELVEELYAETPSARTIIKPGTPFSSLQSREGRQGSIVEGEACFLVPLC